ncbi:hypothetical protein YC2023_081197 [Brassica napus]
MANLHNKHCESRLQRLVHFSNSLLTSLDKTEKISDDSIEIYHVEVDERKNYRSMRISADDRYQEMPRQMKIYIDRCTQVPSIDVETSVDLKPKAKPNYENALTNTDQDNALPESPLQSKDRSYKSSRFLHLPAKFEKRERIREEREQLKLKNKMNKIHLDESVLIGQVERILIGQVERGTFDFNHRGEEYAFLNKFLYDAAANLEIEIRSMLEYMVEDDEQHESGKLSIVEVADISDTSSSSIDTLTITSIVTPHLIVDRPQYLRNDRHRLLSLIDST